jgi:hypothetical protein
MDISDNLTEKGHERLKVIPKDPSPNARKKQWLQRRGSSSYSWNRSQMQDQQKVQPSYISKRKRQHQVLIEQSKKFL